MKKRERHPRITSLRALALLLRVEREIGAIEGTGTRNGVQVLRQVSNELADHVRAGLARGRRR